MVSVFRTLRRLLRHTWLDHTDAARAVPPDEDEPRVSRRRRGAKRPPQAIAVEKAAPASARGVSWCARTAR